MNMELFRTGPTAYGAHTDACLGETSVFLQLEILQNCFLHV